MPDVKVTRDRMPLISIVFMALGVGCLLAAGVVLGLWETGVIGNKDGNSTIDTRTGFGTIVPELQTPIVSTPPATPPSSAPVAQLMIPSIKVDAQVEVKGVDGNGVMESPDGPWDVVWYNFSARPGFGGNAVFSGHVDYVRVGAAVFWNLRDLNPGDEIDVKLADGTLYRYQVTAKDSFPSDSAPIEQIVGPTPKESVTLITCIGTFSHATGQYDQRLVVRAERMA